jgi:hypothetical protein
MTWELLGTTGADFNRIGKAGNRGQTTIFWGTRLFDSALVTVSPAPTLAPVPAAMIFAWNLPAETLDRPSAFCALMPKLAR